jgi:uroporphyrinogen decarboxylase
MVKRERTRRALWREPVDRLPVQVSFTPAMGRRLAEHFAVSPDELPERLDNHLLRLDLSFPERPGADPGTILDWWGAGWSTQTEGYWPTHAPLAGTRELEAFEWPDPDAPDLLAGAKRALEADQGARFVIPNLGFALFERAWSLRGFDQLLMDMVTETAWVEELLERITVIHARLARRFVALGVDGGYFGDDYGAQKSLLFSPKLWRRLIRPRLERLFAVFREADLPVILHSDGDIEAILPDLVDIGLTCLNPVQPEVLDHSWLQREFGEHLSFYGGLSTQEVLPRLGPEGVRDAVRACIGDLAPRRTGLVLGPSHRMQSDIPAANVAAMLEAFAGGTTA